MAASAGRIPRPALARGLSDGLDRGSILLVAGAGYGKTTAIAEALALNDRRAVWVACADAAGDAARLLVELVGGLRAAVPGLATGVGDALAAAAEPIDVQAATGALVAELDQLLIEPLAVVFDDAEALAEAPDALAVVERLLGARGPLSIAIATRQALPLKLAKLRAAGRLTEVGPAELAFSAAECEQVLREAHGGEPSAAQVERALAVSEGWPIGVALAGAAPGEGSADATAPEELLAYLAEEVLDGLDPALRAAIVDSSVPSVLAPEALAALELPADLVAEAERLGLPLRADVAGERSYHPLFRSFLLDRLADLRDADELAALHARVAPAVAAAGRADEAIAHWVQGGEHARALDALAARGLELTRTSPSTVRAWLDAMPAELRSEPDHRLVEAQLMWAAGEHEPVIAPLREAVAGYERTGNAEREWLARLLLADTLVFTGEYAAVEEVARGWDDSGAAGAVAVAWYEAVALASLGRLAEAAALSERLRADTATAAMFRFLDVIGQAGVEVAAGRVDGALALLDEVIGELELHDPLGRLPYALGVELVLLRITAERERALAWLDRCEAAAERVGMGFALRDFRLQRASLLAQTGDAAGGEAEFARAGTRRGAGWRAVYEAEAEAHVAAAAGELDRAAAAAQRALDAAARAPMPWRVLAIVEMGDVLARAGRPQPALDAAEDALAALTDGFADAGGRLYRAWLLAAMARVRDDGLGEAWDEAGELAGAMVRAQWPALRPALRTALDDGALEPDAVAASAPEAMAELGDDEDPAIRRAALVAALGAAQPPALARLAALTEDDDAEVAAAARTAAARAAAEPPPLRFELLGGFAVRRGGWRLDESSWQRPMAARVVRFLLIQDAEVVTEDALFEAFWPDRTTDAARQHLATAISRARRVLDLHGASGSVIEVRDRTYRLDLREHDTVDFRQFEALARRALADGDPAALARAAGMWAGEPLPQDRYEGWSELWRDRLTTLYGDVLGALVGGGDVDAARRLLALEPTNEAAHRLLMTAYARSGSTGRALRQYLECRRALIDEVGVEPAAETTRLQGRILAGEPV